MPFPVISNEQIKQLVTMSDAIDAAHEAFVEISLNPNDIPVRTSVGNSDNKSCLLTMPCYCRSKNLYSVKMVSVFPDNKEKNLPIIHGKLMMVDGSTGQPLAMMDAEYLTALRTGAASGLATKLLSKLESSVLAIVGTGKQALLQVEAMLAVRPIKLVLVKGTSREKSMEFAQVVYEKFCVLARSISDDEELKQADIICTATNSFRPVLRQDCIKTGAHINAIGSYQPTMQELPSTIFEKAFIVVDQMKAALEEAGDIIIPLNERKITIQQILELGQVIKAPRSMASESPLSIFKSVGNAMQDLMLGSKTLEKLRMRV